MNTTDRRRKDTRWTINPPVMIEGAQLAVLMDIRDELKTLNAVFACFNFQQVPAILRQIRSNTAKPRKPKQVA